MNIETMDEASKQALLSAVRSLMIVAGASITAKGIASSETVNQMVGAIMAIIPIVWGIWDKYRSEKKTQAREVVAVNVGIAVADRTVGITPAIPSANVPAVIEAFAPAVPAAPDASGTGLKISPASPTLPQ